MLNIEKIKFAFDTYVNVFDMSNPKIKLKYNHTYRVCEQSRAICDSLKLSNEDKNLAYLIAILHDIGRFEQIKRYDTFNDLKSIDHGDFGLYLLFSEGLIRKFINDIKYDKIIKKAIENHNKYSIEPNLTEKELLHCKIIRDADKIDIIYNILKLDEISIKDDDSNISEEVQKDFSNKRSVKLSHKQTNNDSIIILLSFVFDLNFDYSYKLFRDDNYINLFYDRIQHKYIFKKYIDTLNDYIERKCKDDGD